jgi:imidazolonepropionase-like amidohydrolase
VIVNAAIFWLDVVLLGLLAGNTLGAEAKETPGRNAVNAPFLLNPARVFDTANSQMRAGWSVLVTNNRIAAVGPAAQVEAPTNAVVIPLADLALLPGLMDLHSHIFLHPYNEASWDDQVLKEPVAYRTVQAVLPRKLDGLIVLNHAGGL